MDKIKEPFVSIEPFGGKKIQVRFGYTILYNSIPESGRHTCFIPGFNLFYSSDNDEMAIKKGHAMICAFSDHFFLRTKNGAGQLAIELHKMGFKATKNDVMTVKNLIDRKVIKAKFQRIPEEIPTDFSSATPLDQETQLSIAV